MATDEDAVVQEIVQLVGSSPDQASIERSLSREHVSGTLSEISLIPQHNSGSGGLNESTLSPHTLPRVPYVSSSLLRTTATNPTTAPVPISSQRSTEPDLLSQAPSVSLAGQTTRSIPGAMDSFLEAEGALLREVHDRSQTLTRAIGEFLVMFRERQISARDRLISNVDAIFDSVIQSVGRGASS
ncbi:hypothetical protein GMRT_10968 [Giardia muris]|uniref:Uncharacterized protein n=1 Tax=Giardia muris TaxID=5742 RepID=A0A4Z1SWX6_GIAMU|nr:hypothetical protein GMRT_10968 [Giardia muris]|eukprot:TNJ29345.1 hypothetical protein GMRT_10968 [Giardia muris]